MQNRHAPQDGKEPRGVGQEVDVLKAQKAVLDNQYCAQQITKEKYCAEAIDVQNKIFSNTGRKYEVGLATVDAYISELNEAARVRKVCAN